MGRLSRSAYQKAKLVSRDESLFRLRDHSEWGRRQSHEFYEYITSASLDRPKSACTTCNSETLWKMGSREREGCTSGRKLKSSIKNCAGRGDPRVYTWAKHARHKSTFHRATRGTEADQRPPGLTSFRLDLRCYPLDVVFQYVRFGGIVSRNWGNTSSFSFLIWRVIICNNSTIKNYLIVESFFVPLPIKGSLEINWLILMIMLYKEKKKSKEEESCSTGKRRMV